jgi:hypothetical protein
MLSALRLLPVATLVVTTAACASSGGYYGYPIGARPGVRQIDDRAYRSGYSEGRVQGENDARRGRSFDVGRHRGYRNADYGYDGYGNRNDYRQIFRQGFEAGYSEGYRWYSRAPGYPPSGPNVYGGPSGTAVYRSVAGNSGFRDGFEQGQRDARDGRTYDPVRASRYREGDRGYNGRYGSRDAYKQEYRRGFQQGYDQGYRGWRR